MSWKVLSTVLAGVVLAGCGDDSGGGGGAGGQGGASSTAATSSSSSGAGGGASCGGIGGVTCGAGEYCDFGDNLCGSNDGGGTCMPRPQGCPDIYMPTCGCDGVVYGNECEGNAMGQDASASGGCTPPTGNFACGYTFCATAQQYCQRGVSDVGGEPDSYTCMSLPTGCNDCSCLANEPCGFMCEQLPSGDFMLTCPGG